MKRVKKTEFFETSTDNFVREIQEKVSRNPYGKFLASNAFVFCLKCNEVLLTPQEIKKLVSEKVKQYKGEGVWQKFVVHVPAWRIRCKCGWENYIAIFIFRYCMKIGEETVWRYCFIGSQCPDSQSMNRIIRDLDTWVNRSP